MTFDRLIIATGNHGKFREFTQIIRALSGEDFAREIVFAPEVTSIVVEETGRTYRENSMLKACAWAEESGCPCLADDSGLEVDALGGAPGLYSARVVKSAGVGHASWLLSEMSGVQDRRARFTASLALCVPNEFTLITEGYCYGTISDSPRGTNGFGYDPVFIPDGHTLTFAELDSQVKNSISHRSNAFRKLYANLMR